MDGGVQIFMIVRKKRKERQKLNMFTSQEHLRVLRVLRGLNHLRLFAFICGPKQLKYVPF